MSHGLCHISRIPKGKLLTPFPLGQACVCVCEQEKSSPNDEQLMPAEFTIEEAK